MKYLEVRRHSKRNPPQPHLIQEGVSLARRLGNTLDHFDRVITSTVPRAFETAIAMGYAVDMELEQLAPYGGDVLDEIGLNASFDDAARVVAQGKHAAAYAQKMAHLWLELVGMANEGGCVLVVCHGGTIELGAVACLPNADHTSWGAHASYCEGVRLTFDGEQFVDMEILQV